MTINLKTQAILSTEKIPDGQSIVKWVIGVFFLCVFLFTFNYMADLKLLGGLAGWGQMGDFFGGILNPIIGFGTLIGVWTAVGLQRIELKETKEAIKAQNDLMARQQLETTFFVYLKIYKDNLSQVKYSITSGDKTKELIGSEAIWQQINTFPNIPDSFNLVLWDALVEDNLKPSLRASLFAWKPFILAFVQVARFVKEMDPSDSKKYSLLLALSIELSVWRALYFSFHDTKASEIGQLVTELDLLCLYPNDRVIGEIKNSFAQFTMFQD